MSEPPVSLPLVRRSRGIPHLPGLLFFLISILFLHDVALTGRAYLFRDILTFFHPWQHVVRESVRASHLPLWNHDTFCGIPLLANLQSGFFYPINWLYWVLPFDAALTLGMVLHLTLAGALMRGFLRRVGLANPGAFLGGALFAYGTWTLSHLEFPMKLGSAIWLPLVWSGLWQAMRQGQRRGLARAGLAIALSIFAGYPQITLLGLISGSVLALHLLPDSLGEPGLGRFARLLRVLAWPVILLLGGLTAGAQLLPAREMARLSSKAAAYSPAVAMSRSLPPSGWVGLVDPFFHGFPGVDRYWGGEVVEFCFGTFYLGGLALVLIAGSARTFVRPKRKRRIRREDFAEPTTRPVVPVVVPWFLATGAVVGILLALGKHTPVYAFLHAYVPGFGRTRWPSAAGYLVAAHLAPLAAIGFRAILTDRERIRKACFATMGLGALLLLAWLLARGPLAELFRAAQTAGAPLYQIRAYVETRDAWLASLLVRAALVTLSGAIPLLILDIRSRVGVAWTVMILLDLFLAFRSFGNPSMGGFYERVPSSVREIAEQVRGKRIFTPRSTDQLGNFLYGTRNATAFEWAKRSMLCNANLPAGIAQAHGCEPLNPRRHEAFVQIFGAEQTPWEIKERIFDLWDAALLVTSDVRPSDVPRIESVDQGFTTSRHEPRLGRTALLTGWRTFDDDQRVLDTLFSRTHDPAYRTLLEAPPGGEPPDVPDRTTGRRGEPMLHEYGPNSLRVAWQIGPAGMLRILESWDPGWRATVNGRPAPIYRADFLFMAVPVPEGPCEVRLVYRPESLRRGAAASGLGLLGLAACLFRRRRVPAGSES